VPEEPDPDVKSIEDKFAGFSRKHSQDEDQQKLSGLYGDTLRD